MKHIVLLNPKGGCGKTTIATHIAVYASTMGLRVALADHDKQQSSHDWLKSRPRRCADIVGIAAYDGAALEGDFDVMVHDMPGSAVSNQLGVASACDKLLIPVMPSPIDIKAALRLWMTLSNIGWLDNPNMDIGIIANRVKRNTKYMKTFDSFLERMNIPRVATLRDTQNYIRSLDAGLSLFDLPPGRVADDLAQWQPIMEWTGLFEMEDEELLAMFGMQDELQPADDDFVSLEAFNSAKSAAERRFEEQGFKDPVVDEQGLDEQGLEEQGIEEQGAEAGEYPVDYHFNEEFDPQY